MALEASWVVRPALTADSFRVGELLAGAAGSHRHLDWRNPLDWLERPPYYLIEKNGMIEAALGCPPEVSGICWIRLFAFREGWSADSAWRRLWPHVLEALPGVQAQKVAAIVLQDWFAVQLAQAGFSSHQEIVMLEHHLQAIPGEIRADGVTLREMAYQDLPAVAQVDAAAFVPLWQNSLESLRWAYRQCSLAAVAERNGVIVGYQISTRNSERGHLARLAVHPEQQGRRIGEALLIQALARFQAKGVTLVSVNTQSDNSVSLALYGKAGFFETGERFPVFSLDIL